MNFVKKPILDEKGNIKSFEYFIDDKKVTESAFKTLYDDPQIAHDIPSVIKDNFNMENIMPKDELQEMIEELYDDIINAENKNDALTTLRANIEASGTLSYMSGRTDCLKELKSDVSHWLCDEQDALDDYCVSLNGDCEE